MEREVARFMKEDFRIFLFHMDGIIKPMVCSQDGNNGLPHR